jgi:serpin B
MRAASTATALVGLFVLAVCMAGTGARVEANGFPAAEIGETGISDGELRFALDLYRQVAAGNDRRNLFLSPWSVSEVLAMTTHGARGETLDAMRRTLDLEPTGPDGVGAARAALRDAFTRADPTVELTAANSLWLRSGMNISPSFLDTVKRWHQAEVATLDITDPAAPSRVNAWVSDATHGRIPTIIEQIENDTALILVNAIYFKGAWSIPFDPEATREGSFSGSGGVQSVPMLNRSGTFMYFEDDRVQCVMLPYGRGSLGMVVVLPRAAQELDALVAGLDVATWNTWTGGLGRRAGQVSLPRFHIEQTHDLGPTLSAMGMGIAFDPGRADFGAMSNSSERIFIKEVRHKTFVDVDEAGTEAAAATGAVMGVTSMPTDPPFEFLADHPFLFAIRDATTGNVLFMGTVYSPNGA